MVSGIAKHYSPEEMVGKTVILVANLKPVKLRAFIRNDSHSYGYEGNLTLVGLDKDIYLGTDSSRIDIDMYFVTHAHIDDRRFDEDRGGAI